MRAKKIRERDLSEFLHGSPIGFAENGAGFLLSWTEVESREQLQNP